MLCKQFLIFIIVSIHLSRAQNILNFLDFAAPIFGLLKTGTPEVCYNELGCFRNDGPFGSSSHRPISCVPQSPQIIGTEFLSFSRSSPDEPQAIDAIDSDLFSQLDFDSDKPTKIVVHGFKEGLIIQGFSHETFELVKDGLLYNEDANVILVRWSRGASAFYFQAVANCRVVAAQIANLINYFITERKARPELFHLIGFSLGAHISGYVGKLIPNLGRITALDAAKPYFDGVPRVARIDRNDALFVEAYHTDNGIGTELQVGKFDIFFNGGRKQPGCEQQVVEKANTDGFLDAFFETISCDHKRALQYYVEYLFKTNKGCTPVAYRCKSWKQFQSGQCASCGPNRENCIEVGLHSNANRIANIDTSADNNNKFFITTNDKIPYCVHQYLVKIAIESTTRVTIDGKFSMRFHWNKDSFIDYHSHDLQVNGQREVAFVMASEVSLNTITNIDLRLSDKLSDDSNANKTSIFINSLLLTPLNMIDDQQKSTNSFVYCSRDDKWIGSDGRDFVSLDARHCL